jgi:hypothetical protein
VDINKTFVKADTIGSATPYANYVKVNSKAYDPDNDILTLKIALSADAGITGPTGTSSGSFYIIETGPSTLVSGGTAALPIIPSLVHTVGATGNVYAFANSQMYQDNLSGIITDEDRIKIGATAFAYAEFTRSTETNFATSPIGTILSSVNTFGTQLPVFASHINYVTVNAYTDEAFTIPATIAPQAVYQVNSFAGSINEAIEVYGSYTNPVTTVWIDNTNNDQIGKIVAGDYLVMNFGGTGTPIEVNPNPPGKSRLTRVISVQEIKDVQSPNYKMIKVVTNEPIFLKLNALSGKYEVERYKSIENFASHYHIHKLSGYSLRAAQMPDGTLTRQNEILDVMYDTNIATALEDREVITFRYIVDTFEGGIEPASKIRLARLAKAQMSSLAICNMPSVKQFRDSTNPLFKFDPTRSFDATYIASGGNLQLNPSNIFTLPGIADGANYSAFYGPNLTIREGGRNTSVPPAAHVSNLYIDKYNLALPYSIVAGPRRGVVTGQGVVGVEYAFDRTDLDAIEPFGYNAILNKRGFGLVINANQTAQQTVKSALSQIHVRELLIYIQDGIEAILKNYRWEFNTAQNRLEIKTLADNFLTQILSDGGVYDFQNIMDTTNNTPEIIDSNIGILDTYIEPVRGMGILVHRTTILKTGAIATGNFI